ncbi:hypothetical protein TWF706_002720 [Orbilia oligospora]|nr:hypothetical protein TWF706_002720 [Orbilia oligospora]
MRMKSVRRLILNNTIVAFDRNCIWEAYLFPVSTNASVGVLRARPEDVPSTIGGSDVGVVYLRLLSRGRDLKMKRGLLGEAVIEGI